MALGKKPAIVDTVATAAAVRPAAPTPAGPAVASAAPAFAARPRGELARIPDHFIDQLKNKANVVDVVARRVALKKSGSVMTGLCPFHKERSPSFTVSPARNTYHCFGCGAHGSALSFLIEHDGLPFREAVKELAGEIGLMLPEEMVQGGAKTFDTAPLYAAMARAQSFFMHVLGQTPAAKDYLKARGLAAPMLKRFCIGLAPDEWRSLKEAFPDYESNQAILGAGLVREKERAPNEASAQRVNRYDTFRGRITFGVRDTRGRLVAFGARVLGEGEPKYLNSPETPIFDKSGALFGLFEAREAIRALQEVLVVEGYMDVVMLAQYGVEHAVACMGTAFTRWHLERLLTQASRLVLCFDGDAAGQAAAWKALKTCADLIEDEHDFRFMVLPDGKDPDDYIRTEGKAAFDELTRTAPGFTEFLITRLQHKHGLGASDAGAESPSRAASAEARARFAAEATEIAQRISYGAKLRRIVLDQIALESRMPGAAIKAMQDRRLRPPAKTSLWSVLVSATEKAPATALASREHILQLLDPEDAEEAALAQVLSELHADASDDTTVEGHLLARDALRRALDLILAHREQQVREELTRQLGAGEISEGEYLLLRQELRSRA